MDGNETRVNKSTPQFCIIIKYGLPPLGLASIAAVLERQGIKVDIVDMGVSERKIGNEEELSLAGVDAVGISASMTPRFPQAIAISKALKRTDKDLPVIFGGNHATFMYKEILQNYDSVDMIVLFEGESSMLEITEALSGRKKLADVKGIAYRDKDGRIILTHPAEKVTDLDTLPMPARHLLPMEQYKKKGCVAGDLVSSRGCHLAACSVRLLYSGGITCVSIRWNECSKK